MTFDCQLPTSEQSHAQSASTTSMKSMAEIESELAHILQNGGSDGGSSSNEGAERGQSVTFLPPYNITEHRDLIPLPIWNLISSGNQVVSMRHSIMLYIT